MSFADWFWEVLSPNGLFYSLEERKEKSCCLCACYLLFDLKRLPRKLRFINDKIVEDEAIYNPIYNHFWFEDFSLLVIHVIKPSGTYFNNNIDCRISLTGDLWSSALLSLLPAFFCMLRYFFLIVPSLQISCFGKTKEKQYAKYDLNKRIAARLIWQLVIHSCVIFAYIISRRDGENNGFLAGVSLPPPFSRTPRVSLAPKTPFPFPFKRLPRRLFIMLKSNSINVHCKFGARQMWEPAGRTIGDFGNFLNVFAKSPWSIALNIDWVEFVLKNCEILHSVRGLYDKLHCFTSDVMHKKYKQVGLHTPRFVRKIL